MRRYLLTCLLLILILTASAVFAQDEPIPTLVPPTLIPTAEVVGDDGLPSQSGVTRIRERGVLRVGILYNEPPYGEFTIRGEVSGYDADLARAIAEAWDVELEFVQVTRQNRVEMLRSGAVDLLVAAMIHERELDPFLDFSQTYRVGRQSVMVDANDETTLLINLANQRIGYVAATPAEDAVQAWQARSGVPAELQPFLTLDEAYAALFADEIDAVVAREERLLRIAAAAPDAISILEEALEEEPYAIGLPRQDTPLRNLVNHTLQYLLTDDGINTGASTIGDLYGDYFPGDDFPYDALPIYRNVGEEAPSLATYDEAITFPQGYVAPRMLSDGVLRVAGLQQVDSLPEAEQPIAQINRAVVDELALRWGVTVQAVEGDPIQLVESGQADLAVGVSPDWSLASQVDFSQPYMMHGERLLIPSNRDIERFGDLRGGIVATLGEDSGAQDRAQAWADSINVRVRFFQTTQDGAARSILEDLNATVLYGDTLYLLPIYQQNSDAFEFGPAWYSREYVVLALPRNDIDFRRLVNYTLQEVERDDTLDSLLIPLTPPGEDLMKLDVWPGSSEYLGLSLSR